VKKNLGFWRHAEQNMSFSAAGGLFLLQQLTASGAKIKDIDAQLKAGKSIFDIANDHHATGSK